jgi:hypothetical protein
VLLLNNFRNWLEYTACIKRIKGESENIGGNVPENELRHVMGLLPDLRTLRTLLVYLQSRYQPQSAQGRAEEKTGRVFSHANRVRAENHAFHLTVSES